MEKISLTAEERSDPDKNFGCGESKLLRQAAGRLGWLAGGTRSDLCISRLILSTKFNSGKMRDLIMAEKAMNRVKSEDCFYIIPSGLGSVEDWSIKLYTDASLGNLENSNSTQSFIIFLCGKNGKSAPVAWNSSRLSRVLNIILKAETLACSASMDEAIAVKDMIEEIFRLPLNTLPVNVYIDSNSLEESLKSTTTVENKRLRRDMARIKENLEKRFITSVNWVASKEMIADAMTKQGVNPTRLQFIMQTGSLSEPWRRETISSHPRDF